MNIAKSCAAWLISGFTIIMLIFPAAVQGQAPGGVSTGLKLWLKADAGISLADGTKVATWTDQSAAAYNLTQATVAIQPTFYLSTAANLVNYNPSVVFNIAATTNMTNTTANLFGALSNTGSSYHFIAVAKDNSVQNLVTPNFGNSKLRSIMGNGLTGDNPTMDFQKDVPNNVMNGWRMYTNTIGAWTGGKATVYNGGGIGDGTPALPAAYINQLKNVQPQIVGVGYTLGGSNFLTSWMDGFKEISSSPAATNRITNSPYFSVGTSGGTEYWAGPINEVIAYSRQLSDAEMQQVNSYLAIKYGITLGQGNNSSSVPTYNVGFDAANYNYVASNASVIWDATANTGNSYNIAAIGRDDNSALNQKQSQSVNFSTQMAIGLGTIAGRNGANTNVFATDKSFLIWGDNNGSLPLTTASTAFTYEGSSLNLRMGRIWAIQNINAVQTVLISIPTTAFGTVTPANCEQLRFIHATDAGMVTIDYTANLILNGANYQCLYTFPAGTSYFSFGRIENGSAGFLNLPVVNSSVIFQGKCMENGWTDYYSIADSSKKLFAINKNGNSVPDFNTLTGNLTWQSAAWTATNGVTTTNIMQRLITVTDGSVGTYTVNGGVKIRIYFDSTELKNTYPGGFNTNASWFKHAGSAASTVADLVFNTLNNATFLNPSAGSAQDNVRYVEFSSIQGFSTFGFVASNSSTALPVTLVGFSALVQNCATHLTWQTDMEEGSGFFNVQRSENNDRWETIGNVKASGNSNTVHAYSYNDPQPPSELVFYRLQEIDRDGNFQYSSIRSVDLSDCDAMASNMVLVYPNPTSGLVYITLKSAMIAKTTILYDMSGRKLISRESDAPNQVLDISNLSPGSYIIEIRFRDGSRQQQKIVKY